MSKPLKKTDKELFDLLDSSIAFGNYIFKKHAKQRQKDRSISDLDVLDILEGKPKRNRHRNKSKDKFIYCNKFAIFIDRKNRFI